MEFFFIDDSVQNKPSRRGMESLVAVGCIKVSGTVVGDLERAIDNLTNSYQFPPGQEFKWSPGRELWMRTKLVDNERQRFFHDILDLLEWAGCVVTVVISDNHYRTATDLPTHEMDVTHMCLERISRQCRANPAEGIVITDRAGSRASEEDEFLYGCLESLQGNIGYVRPNSIAFNVVSTSSKFIRLIQAADFVTGCTLAAVSGENRFSPPLVSKLKALFYRESSRIGGFGLKIHPDYKYVNLYHWIVGDTYILRNWQEYELPLSKFPYYLRPEIP